MTTLLALMIQGLALSVGVAFRSRRDDPRMDDEYVAEKKRLFAEAEKTWWDRFEALPENRRTCRFRMLGLAAQSACDNGFECSHCEVAKAFLPADLITRKPDAEERSVAGVRLPAGVFFHRSHIWARVDEDGMIRVGLDDFARRLLGRGIHFNAPLPGTMIEKGETACLIERNGQTVPVLSPVDGRVMTVNHELIDHPERLHEDPYGDGWLYRLRPYNLYHNLRDLLCGVEARIWMEGEIGQLDAMMEPVASMPRAADGGRIVDDLAPALGDRWADVNRHFLLTIEDMES
jgi:glycine cleavage system H lipoate-binding protein